MHMARGPESKQLYPDFNGDFLQQDPLLVNKRFVLSDCVATKLSINDGDTNAEGFQKWTLEIEFSDMTVEG